MIAGAKWIWLSRSNHPELQSSPYTFYCDKTEYDAYCVAEVRRSYKFSKPAKRLHVEVCADTVYRLWINGDFVGSGPVYSGGDNSSCLGMNKRYYTSYDIDAKPDSLSVRALVRKNPTIMAESSAGVGGFILSCDIEYDDGTTGCVYTDENWDIRVLRSRISDSETDFTKAPGKWEKPWAVKYPVDLFASPLPPLCEEEIQPTCKSMFICPTHTCARFYVDFPRIYSAYPLLQCSGDRYTVSIGSAENEDEPVSSETFVAKGKINYFSMQYGSYGKMIIDVENRGDSDVVISDVSLLYRHYPVTSRGDFSCSDETLNQIYRLCADTLEICRQDLHLDSPRHREPLGCTGDYYVQSLMEYFVFGDTALSRFDIVRTGDYLLQNGGKMFHTSYSLIWVMMLYDYYTFSGDAAIFAETEKAMAKLFERFAEYAGEDGIIETPPSFMFLDWEQVDGFSLHHPPKALGQAALNAFYYRALDLASKICALRGKNKMRSTYRLRADAVKKAFNERFFDANKRLYFSGTGSREKGDGEWLPSNVKRKYFTRHVNVLAALFGIFDGTEAETKHFAERVISSKTLGDVQPYFMHYVLDMVYKYGLFGKYGLKMIRCWEGLVKECPKGLAEGWNGFEGDHSHAWGGTPAYQLPRAVLGFEMVSPGFEEIRLSPKLYDLDYARVVMPTPYGEISCELDRGKEPVIEVPEEIKYTLV